MTLDEAKSGDSITVVAMPAGAMRAQLIRLGIGEGSRLTCVLKIPAGPVVVREKNVEVALGRGIASGIEVERCSA